MAKRLVFDGTDKRYWWKYKLNIKSKPKKKEIKTGKIIDFLNRREKEVAVVILLVAIWLSGFFAAKGWAFYSLLSIVLGFIFILTLTYMEGHNGRNNSRRKKSK